MRFATLTCTLVLAGALPIFFAGCGKPKEPKKDGGHSHGDHDHDHDHGHGGAKGGHVMELGNEEYHVEWLDDEATGKIDVYVLDKDMKSLKVDTEKVVIKTKVGDTAKDYDLEPVDQTDGKTDHFQTTDKTLVTILTTIGEATSATLDVTINGKPYSQAFEKHEEHGHNH
jgi:hypothetical protein